MSITKIQSPNETPIMRKVHQSIYPEYFTATSTNYTESDFKYNFSLVDSTGTLYSFKQSALINSGIGKFSPTQIMVNYLTPYFYPLNNSWTDVSSYCLKQYRVDLEEFYGGEVKTATLKSYYKQHIIPATKKDFDYTEHLLNDDDKKFLTNQTEATTIKIRTTDYSVVRFLNGNFSTFTSTTYKSRPYHIRLKITKSDGRWYQYYIPNGNPYWSRQNPLNPSVSVWDNMSGRILEFGCGPKNITTLSWKLDLYRSAHPTGGEIVVYPPQLTSVSLVVGDKYEIWAYCYPYGDQSIRYKFEVVCENANKPGVMLYWDNECGGISQFLFEKRYTESSNVQRYSYRKNYDEFGKASQTTNAYYIGHNDYSRETTVYGGEELQKLSINSDWLTSYDISYLKDVMKAKNIYINYGGTYYPVVLMNETQLVSRTNSGLVQFVYDLEFSNKNIF